ncbi:MAG: right-handed parallel beta-helix repeat-containing protein, partial [Gemmatimonadaceae bacterium]
PTPSPTPGCSEIAATRVVSVSSASQLSSALSNARAGDRIQLADGTYQGQFKLNASGSASQPIVLCGSRQAVIQTGSLTSGNGLVIYGDYWRLIGFTVTKSMGGIAIVGGNYNVIDNLEVRGVGQAGIHMHSYSSHNIVRNSRVHDTGQYQGAYGEGVYIGSYNGQWCSRTNCQPDRSDANEVRNNVFGPYVKAQNVDIKEGTTGTIVTGNTFSGVGMVSDNYNRSWVFVGGNRAVITDNKGSVSLKHGFEEASPLSAGGTTWSTGNVFRRNTADVQSSGYGFSLMGGTSGANVVGCDNSVTNAGSGFSNVRCTP